MRKCGMVGNAIFDAIVSKCHLVKRTRIGEKYKCLRIGYPLSDPSRRRERPGTRKAYAGTRPIRTKSMVLVRVQARKWQSGLVLHKRTSPAVSSSFGFPASNWEALVAYRLHAGIVEVES